MPIIRSDAVRNSIIARNGTIFATLNCNNNKTDGQRPLFSSFSVNWIWRAKLLAFTAFVCFVCVFFCKFFFCAAHNFKISIKSLCGIFASHFNAPITNLEILLLFIIANSARCHLIAPLCFNHRYVSLLCWADYY